MHMMTHETNGKPAVDERLALGSGIVFAALQIGAMMHRRKLKMARVPRDLLLDIASNPGGARRDRLFTSFVRDVQKHLVETGRYSALMTSQDLLVMSGDEAHERVPVLVKKDLTPAEWKATKRPVALIDGR